MSKENLINFQEKKAEKQGKFDKFMRLAVLSNIITVPLWIAIGHPEIALADIWTGVATEEARKKVKDMRARNLALAA